MDSEARVPDSREYANRTPISRFHKGHPRIICTNHNAGITVESTMRLDAKSIEQVEAAITGRRPEHILNPAVLDHPRVQGWLQ